MFGDLDKQRTSKSSKFEQYKKELGEQKEETRTEESVNKNTYSSKEAAEMIIKKQKAADPIMAAAFKNL